MTEAATRFVGPATFQSLTGRPVYTSQWEADEHHESPHVGLARSADLMVIAPASMNTIAKLAHGFADNIVTTVAAALPSGAPLLLAPAMNAEMWQNPITQRNIATVIDVLGCHTVGPGAGWQSCRTSGEGRMSEPDEIYEAIDRLLTGSED
jgi:phosphopantothenoylcysteine decarboxylase/phosphopantothenate--cysteine ligase